MMSTQGSTAAGGGAFEQVDVLTSASVGDFLEVPPKAYRDRPIPLLDEARTLAADLQQRHMLFLTAGPLVDLPSLAFQLAWGLNQLRKQQAQPQPAPGAAGPATPGSGSVPVLDLPLRQWTSASTRKLVNALQQIGPGCIVLLPQLQPHHFGFDLGPLRQVATTRQLYLIGLAEDSATWQSTFGQGHLPYWRTIPLGIYMQRYLVTLLRDLLTNKTKQSLPLPPPLKSEVLQKGSLATVPLDTIASSLRSPKREEVFAELVCHKAASGPLTRQDVLDTIAETKDDSALLRQRFFAIPELRDKLVVLTIHLFDGLLDDQFFEATDRLIERVWSRREPSLRSLDHQQLNRHNNFFYRGQSSDGEILLSESEGQRLRLLRIIWNQQRRYVLSALDVIIELIRESDARQTLSWKLYGTNRRRELLRKSLGATLSDIGLISIADVEESLLRLASEPSPAVQAVAASAMARWRQFAREKQLYEMLGRWLNDPAIERMVQGFATTIDGKPLENGMRNLQLTAGLAIAYAAEMDPPNKIASGAMPLLRQLVQDPDLTLRKSVMKLVFARIGPMHLVQLQDLLRELAYEPSLHGDLVGILQETYRTEPRWVVDTLEAWYTQARAGANMDRPSRNALLTLVCTAFGRLDYSSTLGTVDPTNVCALMRAILELEGDGGVRDAARRTAVRLPDENQLQLQTLMTRLSKGEMDSLVGELGEIYLEQRQALQGGTGRIRIDGKQYPVWSQPSQRPLTDIEELMLRWLRDPGEQPHQQIARQLALRALVTFRELLDDGVAYSRPNDVTPAVLPSVPPPPRPVGEVGLYPRTFYEHRVVPWLAANGRARRSLRPVARGAVSEMMHQSRRADATTHRLISDLAARGAMPEVANLAQLLRDTLAWAQRRETIFYMSVTLSVFLLLVLGLLATSLW
jgi:hypothetical protein